MSGWLGVGVCPERLLAESQQVGSLQAVIDCSSQGLSDSQVFEFRWAGERRAIKGWPDTSGRVGQLQTTHHVQHALAQQLQKWTSPTVAHLPSESNSSGGICRIPAIHPWSNGQSILACQNRLWEWGSWLVGSSLRYESFDHHHLHQAMMAVEQIHAASHSIGTDEGASARWQRRIELFRQLLSLDRRFDRHISVQNNAVGDTESAPTQTLQDLWDCWRRIAPQAFVPLIDSFSPHFPRQWIVGDLWRDHLLFADHLPCGIIDWGATSWDWRGWDWIRLLTTTPFWNQLEAWRRVAQSLEENGKYLPWLAPCSLDEKTSQMAELGRFQIYLTAGQWILWSRQSQQRQLLSQPKSQRRLSELLSQLKSWR
jgi:hypothetical protein